MQIFSEKARHKLHLDKNSKDSSPTSLEKSSLKKSGFLARQCEICCRCNIKFFYYCGLNDSIRLDFCLSDEK